MQAPHSSAADYFFRFAFSSARGLVWLSVCCFATLPLWSRQDKQSQPDDLNQVIQLVTQCEQLDAVGQFGQAIPLCDRALAITQKYFGPKHEALLRVLNDLGSLYIATYDYSRAEAVLQQGLSIAEAAGNVSYTASMLNNLSAAYQNQGKYRAADPLLARSLKLTEQLYGTESLQFGIALDNSALLHRKEGDVPGAEQLASQAVVILQKVQGEQGNDYVSALNNLASIYDEKGDAARSIPLHEKAISIREQLFGKNDASLVVPLNDLAAAYDDRMNFPQAEKLYRRSLSISEATEGPNAPEVANTLGNLGLLYVETARFKDAEPLLKRALQIRVQSFGEQNPDVARVWNNLGILYQLERDDQRAEESFQHALTIWENVLSPQHPDLAAVLSNLAFVNWKKGDKQKAALFLQRSNDIFDSNLRLILASGSEESKRAYLERLQAITDFTISFYSEFADSDLEVASQAALFVLQRKGLVIDSTADELGNLRRHLGPKERELLDKLRAVRGHLADLGMHVSNINSAENQQQYQRERADEDDIEQEISSRSALFKTETAPLSIAAIQRVLQANSAVLEYVSYFWVNPAATDTKSQRGEQRYAAYVLNGNGRPVWINLGPAQPIDALVARYRASLMAPTSTDADAISLQLYNLVVLPMAAHIQGKRHLFIAPDGALNLIPFSTLRGADGKSLAEDGAVSFLSAGRDLLRQDNDAKPHMPPLAVASPDYDAELGSDGSGQAIQTSSGLHFAPLHGTLREVDAIHELLPSLKISTDRSATKEMLERANAPLVLHVATHGFFLESSSDQSNSGGRGESLLPTREIRDPLLRSGLAFAGANHSENGRSPGILTALEASSLDLWGTQLVVLSACDTGIGTVRNGDGVYGLRRAMVMAGARCQVMSLWKIDDYATKDLMSSFYAKVLAGSSVADALRASQMEIARDSERQHPYYWASFIASGDCGTIDLKRAIATDKPDSSADLRAKANQIGQQGNRSEAEALLVQALEIDQQRSAASADLNEDRHALAEIYYEEGKTGDAEKTLEQALASEEQELGPLHPGLAPDLKSLGLLYANQGDTNKAEPLLRRFVDIRERNASANELDLSDALHTLAGLLYQEKKYQEAEPLLLRTIAIEEKQPGSKLEMVNDLNYLAAVYSHEQKYSAAEPVLKRALALQEQAKGPNDEVVGTILGNIAFVLRKQGREAEAKQYEERADRILGNKNK